jgi:oleate hydratase
VPREGIRAGAGAARIAVYTLLGLDKKVTPVTEYWKKPDVLAKAIHTSYRN